MTRVGPVADQSEEPRPWCVRDAPIRDRGPLLDEQPLVPFLDQPIPRRVRISDLGHRDYTDPGLPDPARAASF